MNKYEDTIKKYYQGQQLSEQAINNILARDDQESEFSPSLFRRLVGNPSRIKFAVAVMMVSMVITAVISQFYHSNKDISQLVLAEISMNHKKRLDAEFVSEQYIELNSLMDRLDFKIQPPLQILETYALLGGRYCSIQGELAAQLKVKDKITNEVATLYVTPLTPRLERVQQQILTYENITISMWQKRGKFFGLAQDGTLSKQKQP